MEKDGFHLIRQNDMLLRWRILNTVAGSHVEIRLFAPTQGWVGVGLNPLDRMLGAHFVLGYFSKNGTPVIEEHFGDTYQSHKPVQQLGRSEICVAKSLRRVDEGVELLFTVPIEVMEKKEKIKKSTKIIIAFSKSAWLVSYHAFNRAALDIDFF